MKMQISKLTKITCILFLLSFTSCSKMSDSQNLEDFDVVSVIKEVDSEKNTFKYSPEEIIRDNRAALKSFKESKDVKKLLAAKAVIFDKMKKIFVSEHIIFKSKATNVLERSSYFNLFQYVGPWIAPECDWENNPWCSDYIQTACYDHCDYAYMSWVDDLTTREESIETNYLLAKSSCDSTYPWEDCGLYPHGSQARQLCNQAQTLRYSCFYDADYVYYSQLGPIQADWTMLAFAYMDCNDNCGNY